MRAILLWVLIFAAPVFASGMSVCLEWEVIDAGPPAAGDGGEADDGGSGGEVVDAGAAGPPSIYGAPPRRCLRYGIRSFGERGCSSVPGESLVLLALLVARWRR